VTAIEFFGIVLLRDFHSAKDTAHRPRSFAKRHETGQSSPSYIARMGAAALAEAPLTEPPIEDAAVVAQVLAGRPEAFALLVERYDRAVYHLALRTLRDAEEAKDAVQETFFKAFRSLHTYRPQKRFSTWIFAICYHAALDRIGRRKRTSGDEVPDRADPAPGPEAVALMRSEARELRAAIEALPERYRVVITLYHLQGKQYEEIAQVLGLPLGTVKTHLHRAKEMLRARMASKE
jgi:RNA polymerase sigma-70 factor (ECF subfamily)